MRKKYLAWSIALPVIILLEGVTNYFGNKYYGIVETNPLFIGIEGTWNTLVLASVMSILFLRMMISDAENDKMEGFVNRASYKTITLFYVLFLINNVHSISKAVW